MLLTLYTIRQRRLAAALVTFIAAFAGACATSPPALFAKPSPVAGKRAVQTNWEWIHEAWTGDSRPFEEIRRQIDEATRSGARIQDIVTRLGAAASQRPRDPKAQFAWAYAVYQIASARQTPYVPAYEMLLAPRNALAEAQSPHAYEYDRLRFLVDAYGPDFTEEVVPLGKRLLAKRPDDNQVERVLANDLAVRPSRSEQQQALAYARDLAKRDPSTMAVYSVPATIAMVTWVRSRSHRDAVKARLAWETWLRHAPPDDAFRAEVAFHLRLLKDK